MKAWFNIFSLQFQHKFTLLGLIFTISLCLRGQTSHVNSQDFENGQSIFIAMSLEEFEEAFDSVFLFSSNGSFEKYYYQTLFTPACEDTLCKPIIITLIWDLLGNYQSFRLVDGIPLTKIDHEPFSEAEYNKLHTILADDDSILGSFSKENIAKRLLTKTSSKKQYDVDAVSGATPPEIREKIVEGALYTCHTLWHLSRGKICDQVLNFTENNLLDEEFLHQLILSQELGLITFAFKRLDVFGASNYHKTIIKAIQDNHPLVASQMISHLPHSIVDNHEFAIQLWNIFDRLDFLSQKQILTKYSSCHQLPDNLLEKLIRYSGAAIESQYVQILRIVLNQVDIPPKEKKLLLEVSKRKKEGLSHATVQLFPNIPYHEKNIQLKNDILHILKN